MIINHEHVLGHLPKGSFHSYCRMKRGDLQDQIPFKSRTFMRNIRTGSTNSRGRTERHPVTDSKITFEQYLDSLEKTKENQYTQSRKTVERATDIQINSNRQTKCKKLENEEVIESPLPFFKCRLSKTDSVIKNYDFRIKDHRFKLKYNIIESNTLQRRKARKMH